MSNFRISFMEQNDIQKSAEVLSIAMLNSPHHLGVFLGNGENERLEIEKMFFELFNNLPGIVFLAKENEKIIGVMRMKSCIGQVIDEPDIVENDINWRKSVWSKEWAAHDPVEQHWHLGPIGVLPSHMGRGVGTELMQRFCKEGIIVRQGHTWKQIWMKMSVFMKNLDLALFQGQTYFMLKTGTC